MRHLDPDEYGVAFRYGVYLLRQTCETGEFANQVTRPKDSEQRPFPLGSKPASHNVAAFDQPESGARITPVQHLRAARKSLAVAQREKGREDIALSVRGLDFRKLISSLHSWW